MPLLLSDHFRSELMELQTPQLRKFVEHALDCSPAYQLTAPAGVSQRHHPADERGEGGQTLHVKRVFRVCLSWSDDFSLDETNRDRLLAAALLHDIVKYGPDDKPMPKLWKDHDTEARPYLGQWIDHIRPDDFEAICEAIRVHMGPWGNAKAGMGDPVTIGHLLHMADYIASETWFTVEPLCAQ